MPPASTKTSKEARRHASITGEGVESWKPRAPGAGTNVGSAKEKRSSILWPHHPGDGKGVQAKPVTFDGVQLVEVTWERGLLPRTSKTW